MKLKKRIPLNALVNYKTLEHFDCGEKQLNKFLKEFARINETQHISKTFLFCEDEKLIGYFTLCSSSIEVDLLPQETSISLPKYNVPTILLARFAVAKEYQGQGYGKEMMKEVIRLVNRVSEYIGVYGITVDTKEKAKDFYIKYGFNVLNSNCLLLHSKQYLIE